MSIRLEIVDTAKFTNMEKGFQVELEMDEMRGFILEAVSNDDAMYHSGLTHLLEEKDETVCRALRSICDHFAFELRREWEHLSFAFGKKSCFIKKEDVIFEIENEDLKNIVLQVFSNYIDIGTLDIYWILQNERGIGNGEDIVEKMVEIARQEIGD